MIFKKAIDLLTNQNNPAATSLKFKYPSRRDILLRSTENWLKGKQEDDGAEGLWRIHNGLYDLSTFIEKHPGGPLWIKYTKGTDITEAFEVHHISNAPELMIAKFFVRNATEPRNSPFTFKNDGFYKTLKRNIQVELRNAPKWPIVKSKLITDFLFCFYVLTSMIAAYTWSFALGAVAGILLNFTVIAAHNFFHQKDNFRMYYFDFSLMSSKSWRISHVMSHHIYTNTIKDMEIMCVEPWLQYLPRDVNMMFRYASWLFSPFVYCFLFFGNWLTELVEQIKNRKRFVIIQLLPLIVPILMYACTFYSVLLVFLMYIWILLCGSFMFGLVGLNAAHHHPDIFHDGDATRPDCELDWGVHQLDAVMDRHDITGSHFLVLTNFGDHALHHLFPTIDHGILSYLYPTFKTTCEEFGVDLRMISQLDLVLGQFRQLVKVVPNPKAPKPLKKIIALNTSN